MSDHSNTTYLNALPSMLFIDYPADISRYINVPGRVCAKPCGSLVCDNVGEVCQEQAESSPQCVCPGEYTLSVSVL